MMSPELGPNEKEVYFKNHYQTGKFRIYWDCGYFPMYQPQDIISPTSPHPLDLPLFHTLDLACSEFDSVDTIVFFLNKLETDMKVWPSHHFCPYPAPIDGSDPLVRRDILCAIIHRIDLGRLAAIGSIRWWKKICRQCKGRDAIGNTVWAYPCIARRCEHIYEFECDCLEDKYPEKQPSLNEGLYEPIILNGKIQDATLVPPRRLWDTKFNRVLLFYGAVIPLCEWCYDIVGRPQMFDQHFIAISHSWVEGMSETAIYTRANSFLWPVPCPAGSQSQELFGHMSGPLDHIPSHLQYCSSRGSDYVWLDVLCLRQRNAGVIDDEWKRIKEWEVDVPTIGNIYRMATGGILRYLNGLGNRYIDTSWKAWQDERHWINRSWTLQETHAEERMINLPLPAGGIFSGIPLNAKITGLKLDGDVRAFGEDRDVSGTYVQRGSITIRDLLKPSHALAQAARSEQGCSILQLVKAMSMRSATVPLDKIAGINYMMWPKGVNFNLPIYDRSMSIEEAWFECVSSMRLTLQLELLFLYPLSGNETLEDPLDDWYWGSHSETIEMLKKKHYWVPTWKALSSQTESQWQELEVRILSKELLPNPNHPWLVPTFMSGLTENFGTLCFDQMSIFTDTDDSYSMRIFENFFNFYGPKAPHSPFAENGPFFRRWVNGCVLLSLGIEHNIPMLLCRPIENPRNKDIEGIWDEFTKYPRTLVVQKIGILKTDERVILDRFFPLEGGWPKRHFDAIYII